MLHRPAPALALAPLLLAVAACSVESSASHEAEIAERDTLTMSENSANTPAHDKVVKTKAEWKELLTPMQYKVLRKAGTERAFTGEYWDSKVAGTYVCAGCSLELFDSETKYESGTGWPSFWAPIDDENVDLHEDRSLWSVRTEVVCSRCDGHLGHVFDDGPRPTGQRYCMNSAALRLVPTSAEPEE